MRFNFLFFILQKRDEKGEGKEIPSFFVLQKPDEKSLENAQNNEIPTISMVNSGFKVPNAPGDYLDFNRPLSTDNSGFKVSKFICDYSELPYAKLHYEDEADIWHQLTEW